MKRIRQWIQHLGVREKLVVYGYMTITPVLVIICLALLFNNYTKVQKERLDNDLSSVNTLADSINGLQTDIKDFSTYICINQDVHELLTTENIAENNENAKLWLEKAPMQIVQDMISLKGHIKTIAIYPENGIRPYLRCMDGSAYVADMDEIHASDIYKETIDSDSGMVWKQVEKGAGDTYETNRYDKVVLYREIFDLTQKKTLGYIVIGVDQQRFLQLCESAVKNEQEGVLVLDRNGGELCRTGSFSDEVLAYLKSDVFASIPYKQRKTHFTYKNYDIVCNQSSANISMVFKYVPGYRIQKLILDIAYMPLLLLAGMLIGLLPLLLIISNIVTRPLRKLSLAIEEVSTGDFEQQVEVTTCDEIGELAACFNRMVQDIRTLINENYVIRLKERESELAALQAQINPHFLYNTLDCLYWQAIEAGNDEIAESIIALSELFRLVLSQGKGQIAVHQEIDLISHYLQIQKMRFSKRLTYEIQVEEDVMQATMPKLVLQPFVENAIVHGFENADVPCQIQVLGRRTAEGIQFEVRDTGVGMTEQQLAAIWEEDNSRYAKQRIGRYAIKNIKERLELKYGDKCSLQIQSEIGKGTTVRLMIPYEEEEKCR